MLQFFFYFEKKNVMFKKKFKQTGPIVPIDPKKSYVECIY